MSQCFKSFQEKMQIWIARTKFFSECKLASRRAASLHSPFIHQTEVFFCEVELSVVSENLLGLQKEFDKLSGYTLPSLWHFMRKRTLGDTASIHYTEPEAIFEHLALTYLLLTAHSAIVKSVGSWDRLHGSQSCLYHLFVWGSWSSSKLS